MNNVRYGSSSLVLLLSIYCFYLGGSLMWVPIGLIAFIGIFLDHILPRDEDRNFAANAKLLNFFLYATLPLLLILHGLYAWRFFNIDFNFAVIFNDKISISMPFFTEKGHETNLDFLGGFISLALLTAAIGTTVAHELCHRTWSKWDLFCSNAILAFTCDTTFATEHVYGHHRNVATHQDPASARRDENFWYFFVRSTIGAIKNAWIFEKKRLTKKKIPIFSLQNRIILGQLLTLAYASFWYMAADGVEGIILFLAIALNGKLYLELINYVEHYGLVRLKNQPVLPRHSWNSNHMASSILLYNLTRHSHHHAKGHLPFWKLKTKIDAPLLPYSYLSMLILALFPPVFTRIMRPELKKWDENFATEAERLHAS